MSKKGMGVERVEVISIIAVLANAYNLSHAYCPRHGSLGQRLQFVTCTMSMAWQPWTTLLICHMHNAHGMAALANAFNLSQSYYTCHNLKTFVFKMQAEMS